MSFLSTTTNQDMLLTDICLLQDTDKGVHLSLSRLGKNWTRKGSSLAWPSV